MKKFIAATVITIAAAACYPAQAKAAPMPCTPENPAAPYNSVCTSYGMYCSFGLNCSSVYGQPGTWNPGGYTPPVSPADLAPR